MHKVKHIRKNTFPDKLTYCFGLFEFHPQLHQFFSHVFVASGHLCDLQSWLWHPHGDQHPFLASSFRKDLETDHLSVLRQDSMEMGYTNVCNKPWLSVCMCNQCVYIVYDNTFFASASWFGSMASSHNDYFCQKWWHRLRNGTAAKICRTLHYHCHQMHSRHFLDWQHDCREHKVGQGIFCCSRYHINAAAEVIEDKTLCEFVVIVLGDLVFWKYRGFVKGTTWGRDHVGKWLQKWCPLGLNMYHGISRVGYRSSHACARSYNKCRQWFVIDDRKHKVVAVAWVRQHWDEFRFAVECLSFLTAAAECTKDFYKKKSMMFWFGPRDIILFSNQCVALAEIIPAGPVMHSVSWLPF